MLISLGGFNFVCKLGERDCPVRISDKERFAWKSKSSSFLRYSEGLASRGVGYNHAKRWFLGRPSTVTRKVRNIKSKSRRDTEWKIRRVGEGCSEVEYFSVFSPRSPRFAFMLFPRSLLLVASSVYLAASRFLSSRDTTIPLSHKFPFFHCKFFRTRPNFFT